MSNSQYFFNTPLSYGGRGGGSDSPMAGDLIGGVMYPYAKVKFGAEGEDTDVSEIDPLPVTVISPDPLPVTVISPDPLPVEVVAPDPLPVEIISPMEITDRGDKGIPVFVQDQTTGLLDLRITERLGTYTLSSNTVIDSYTILLSAGHGLDSSNINASITIADTVNGLYLQAAILGVSGAIITLDTPVNRVYLTSQATVVVGYTSMKVDGSGTPRIFSVAPISSQAGDLTSLTVEITDDKDMDFETFGGLTRLTRGVVVRVKNGDGTYRVLYNFKQNGAIIGVASSSAYADNNGGAKRRFLAKISWAGADYYGVAVRIDGSLGEELQVVIQDDLTDLSALRMIAQGSELQD